MKRQVQAEGVRQWYGDDLISLQSEPMKVLDKFFEDYGNMIISGCKVKGNSITPGLVGLTYENEGSSIYKVCEFRGLDSVESWPVFLSLSKEVIDGKYASEQTKPIIEQYIAKPDYLEPDGIYISINSNGQVFAYESDDAIETRMVTLREINDWNRSRADAVSDVRGGVPSNVNTLNQLYNWVQANYLHKTLRSNSHTSTSTESVATSKAVNDAKTSVMSTIRDGAAPGYNTFKKLYDYVVGNYILNSRVNDSHSSASTNNVASSKAVLDAKTNVLSTIRGGVSTTYDTLKKLYDYVVNNYISNGRVSNLHTSQSTTNVASSKAVSDAKSSVLSTIRGGVSSSYDTLKELLSYVTGNYVSNSRVSDSHISDSKTDVASSKAIKDAKSSAVSTVLGGATTYNTLHKLYNYIVGSYVSKSSISSSHTSTSTSTVASSKAVSDAKSSVLSTIRGGVESSYDTLKELYSYIVDNYITKSSISSSYSSTSTSSVASSKAVYDGRNYAINTVRGSISSTYNSLKKLYDYIGANFVSNSRVSNSHSSTSTSSVASSKAVYEAKNSAISTVVGGEATYNTLKKLYNYVLGNYIAKSSISSSHTSASTTNVASSKAVYDGRNYAINTVRDGISSSYNTLKKLYNYVAGNYISNSRISNSYTSSSTTAVASSRAVRDSVNSAVSRVKDHLGFDSIDSWNISGSSHYNIYTECNAIKYANGLVKLTIMCDRSPGNTEGLDQENDFVLPEKYRPISDVIFVGAGSVSGDDHRKTKYKLLTTGKIENGTVSHAVVMYQAVMTPDELEDCCVL